MAGTISTCANTTDALVEFALGSSPAHAPAATFETAGVFLTDTLGCALAGSNTETNQAMLEAFSQNQGSYRLPGRPELVDRDSAAVLAAHAIHCLEWDAVHEPAVVHAMSVTTGALWAEVQTHKALSGKAFLESVVVGVDIASRLGIATKGPLRFFRPATAGLIGAAAAVARLRGFTAMQTKNAIGLAYSQVQGTMQAHLEGTPALAMQVALSARAALNACDLAAAGLQGPHDVFDGKFGYFALIEEDGDTKRLVSGLGTRFSIDELSIKPYPSGRASHGALSVLLRHIHAGTVNAENFAGMTARVPPLVHRLVGRPMTQDMSPAYARLCLPFLTGLALRDKTIDPRRFTPADFDDPGIMAAASCVRVLADDNQDLNALSPQEVSIELKNGERLTERLPAVLGAPKNPVSTDELRRKFELAASLAPVTAASTGNLFIDLLAIKQTADCWHLLAQLAPNPNSQ